MGLTPELLTCAENIWRRYPELFHCLGAKEAGERAGSAAPPLLRLHGAVAGASGEVVCIAISHSAELLNATLGAVQEKLEALGCSTARSVKGPNTEVTTLVEFPYKAYGISGLAVRRGMVLSPVHTKDLQPGSCTSSASPTIAPESRLGSKAAAETISTASSPGWQRNEDVVIQAVEASDESPGTRIQRLARRRVTSLGAYLELKNLHAALDRELRGQQPGSPTEEPFRRADTEPVVKSQRWGLESDDLHDLPDMQATWTDEQCLAPGEGDVSPCSPWTKADRTRAQLEARSPPPMLRRAAAARR